MILGLSSFAFGWSIGIEGQIPNRPFNELDVVNATLNAGLHLLQIGDNLPLHSLSDERLEKLKIDLQKNNIQLEIGARKLTAQNLSKYLDLARYFGCPILRFVIDGNQYEPDLKSIAAIVSDFVPELKKQNLTLGIENHDRFKVKELANLMEKIGSDHVGICLDCVNSMGAGEGLEYVAEILAPYTVNLHVKDFNVERLHHKMGFTITGAIAGTGMTNVPMLIEKLSKYNRCQSAVLEQWVPFENNEDETIKKEAQWAEQSIQYLKSLPYFKS